MRTTVSDIAGLVAWLAIGVAFAWVGIFFIESYSPTLSSDAQLFYLFGVLLGLCGAAICVWLLFGLGCALVASYFAATGKVRLAQRFRRLTPGFLRRLVGPTVALCLVTSPSIAIDLSFSDTAEEQTSLSEVDTSADVHAETSPAPTPAVPADEATVHPTPSQAERPTNSQEPDPSQTPTAAPTPNPAPPTADTGAIDLSFVPARPGAPSKNAKTSRPTTPRQPATQSPPVSKKSPLPTTGSAPGQGRRTTAENTIVVLRGDSLWSIAWAELGPSATDAQVQHRVQDWYRRNSSTIGANPHLIYPGTILTAPAMKDR